jgi:hypothetical protein
MAAVCVAAFGWTPTEVGKMDVFDLKIWVPIAKQRLARGVL